MLNKNPDGSKQIVLEYKILRLVDSIVLYWILNRTLNRTFQNSWIQIDWWFSVNRHYSCLSIWLSKFSAIAARFNDSLYNFLSFSVRSFLGRTIGGIRPGTLPAGGAWVSCLVDVTEVSLLVDVFFLPEFNGLGFANSITCSLT